ncbi:MAG TPA: histidine kinase, partial [Pyrinomonadaceae bacterium]|nr:histidine kinase [Pyrinomonadaceae bacterium]
FARLHSEVRTNERLLYESKLHEKMLAERTANAQLRALQSQINPHFFFNTLNTIAALANRNSADAKQLILNLAAMYRHTLRCTHTTLITLEDDLEFVRSYLTIERARFGDRLNFSLEVPNSVDGLMLPGLVLQPIVENAIKHGIGRNVGGGDISIEVKREEQEFSITVCNKTETRPDLRAEKVFVEGHALKNVRDRLEGIYGSAHKFSIEYKEDHVCVSVSQPIVHA